MNNWFGYGGRIHTWGNEHPVQGAIAGGVVFSAGFGVIQLLTGERGWSISGLVGGAVVFGLLLWVSSRDRPEKH